jgi:hypothetical protein
LSLSQRPFGLLLLSSFDELQSDRQRIIDNTTADQFSIRLLELRTVFSGVFPQLVGIQDVHQNDLIRWA